MFNTRKILISVFFCFLSFLASAEQQVAIAIHGGAGTLSKTAMTKEKQLQYEAELERAVKAGYALLKSGASGEQAVIKTLQILERSPLFNAGIGAVYNFDEEHELDASIMLGQTRKAGAVAGVKRIKSPIEAAAAVMNQSEHVMLSG
jgi:beta-aspartyl-peptidase (threonine type)